MKENQIKNVVCVGGSSSIPMVKDLLEENFYDESKILIGTNPEEDIARGASICAKYILEYGYHAIRSIANYVETHLNYSVGLIIDDDFYEIFEKGAVVPQTREIEVSVRIPGESVMHTTVGYKDDTQDTPIMLKKYIINFAEQWTIDASDNISIMPAIKSSGRIYNNAVKISNIFFTQDQLNDMSNMLTNLKNRLDSETRMKEIEVAIIRLLLSAEKKVCSHPKRSEILRQLSDIDTWLDGQLDNDSRSVTEYENKLNELKKLIATYGL